jgi:hypothetical protein
MTDAEKVLFDLLLLPFCICGLIFWAHMLIQCLTNEHGRSKLFWTAVIVSPHSLGALIYYFIRWRPRRRAELGLAH